MTHTSFFFLCLCLIPGFHPGFFLSFSLSGRGTEMAFGFALYGAMVGLHSLSFWKSIHKLGTVPTAVAKGAQQAGIFVFSHLVYCRIDRNECLTYNYGNSLWNKVRVGRCACGRERTHNSLTHSQAADSCNPSNQCPIAPHTRTRCKNPSLSVSAPPEWLCTRSISGRSTTPSCGGGSMTTTTITTTTVAVATATTQGDFCRRRRRNGSSADGGAAKKTTMTTMLQAPLPPNGNKSGRMGSAHSNHSFILNPRAQKKSKAAIRGLSFASRCTHVSLFLLFFLVLEYIERAELRRNAQHAE